MSIPCPSGLPSMSTLQFLIVTPPRRTWIPSSFAPETETPSSIGSRYPSMEIPFSPPTPQTSRTATPLPPAPRARRPGPRPAAERGVAVPPDGDPVPAADDRGVADRAAVPPHDDPATD